MTSVLLRRGSVIESRHRIHLAVVDATGRREAFAGDPEFVTFLRSAAKPMQAIPLVEDGVVDGFGISTEELALCCGSHGGEPAHLQGVRNLLARCDLDEAALACGALRPMSDSAAHALLASGGSATAIHNNCSGKHAGMLALARHRGWSIEGYTRPEHPVQRRMRREVARWTDLDEDRLHTGVDGCGVVCFGMTIEEMARGYARLGSAARDGASGPRAVVDAMVAHPFMVAGTGRLCTRLMEATSGRIFAKVGAEGVYCAGVREGGLGIAVKAEDGARRAAEVAVLRALELLGLLSPSVREALADDLRVPIRNARGEIAAVLEADFELIRDGSSGN
ncbi:MAG: asparaginase [Gemmatimonadota bacterium]